MSTTSDRETPPGGSQPPGPPTSTRAGKTPAESPGAPRPARTRVDPRSTTAIPPPARSPGRIPPLSSGPPTEVDGPPLRLAFAGGGTGGHIVPGLHLLGHLDEASLADLLWFQSGRPVERAVMGERPPFADRTERVVLPLEPEGGGAPRLLGLALRTPRAVRAARRVLREHRSDVLLGLGGFTCLPAVLAARSLGLPVALLEVNAVRGKATRALAPFAARVFHAWPASVPARAGRHVHTGAPIGPEFAPGAPEPGVLEPLGLRPDRPLCVVLGGSQGATGLNRFVEGHAKRLVGAGLQVLHQTGPGRGREGLPAFSGYRPVEYLRGVDRYLRAATVVLCRGGASTLAEVAAAGRPAFVVPYPHHRDGHQLANARELGDGVLLVPEERLGARVVEDLLELASPRGACERERMSLALRARVPADGGTRILAELRALRARP